MSTNAINNKIDKHLQYLQYYYNSLRVKTRKIYNLECVDLPISIYLLITFY